MLQFLLSLLVCCLFRSCLFPPLLFFEALDFGEALFLGFDSVLHPAKYSVYLWLKDPNNMLKRDGPRYQPDLVQRPRYDIVWERVPIGNCFENHHQLLALIVAIIVSSLATCL